jgi:multimeric flavodoxin WrbA
MTKFLLISGSPRVGNCEYILKKVYAGIKSNDKGLVLLRQKKIKHCLGCLACDKNKKKCVTKDDMREMFKKLEWADVIVIATPNYYDNVSGLLKDFIDRTNPYYETDTLKGKKIVDIVIGGGSLKNSKKVSMGAIKSFADCHKLSVVCSYHFCGLGPTEVRKDKKSALKINSIIKKVNSL